MSFIGFSSFRDPNFFKIPYKKANDLGNQLAKKYGMQLQETTGGSSIDATKCDFCMLFINWNARTIEEARPMVKEIAEKLWKLAKEDPSFQAYFIEACKTLTYLSPTISKERIGIRMDFWDKEVNRPLYPYLAQIVLKDGIFYYYYADPNTQALIAPIEEKADFFQ